MSSESSRSKGRLTASASKNLSLPGPQALPFHEGSVTRRGPFPFRPACGRSTSVGQLFRRRVGQAARLALNIFEFKASYINLASLYVTYKFWTLHEKHCRARFGAGPSLRISA